MIHKVLLSRLPLKRKTKRILLYLSKKRVASKSWKKRHREVFGRTPKYKNKVVPSLESKHGSVWKFFSNKVNPETLRICAHISGVCDPKIVPENIYQSDIEPSLNNTRTAHFLANKSLYNTWFDSSLFPADYLHRIDGELMDDNLAVLSKNELWDRMNHFNFPVVIKPNVYSNGGKEVLFIQTPGELIREINIRDNFVVQELIEQHPDMAKYHPESLNTVRVYVYRSVITNEPVVLHAALRTGNGSRLDNVSAGGFVSMIRDDGSLSGYAVNRLGEVFKNQPITNHRFDDVIPKYDELLEISKKVSRKMFYIRVVGLDMGLDINGNWRCIEVNTESHSIRFSQYFGVPFFGDYTDEVIEYCRNHHWVLKK